MILDLLRLTAPANFGAEISRYYLSMFSPTAAQKAAERKNGLDLIWESRVLYAEILYCFRECHDLCVSSKLFTKETILQVDQCAVDFRQLSLDTVTVAKRVSNQWLDTAIKFFANIDDVEDPKEILVLLGKQARQLAFCFKIIATWARDLGGRFHEAQDGTVKEATDFKKEFEAAVQRADEMKEQMAEQHAKAAEICRELQISENSWKIAHVELSWSPIASVITGVGIAFATAEASKMESEAAKKLCESQELLRSKQSQNEMAKFVASKAINLVQVLGKLEETCEAIAAFWTEEADNYDSQGAKMANNQVVMLKSMNQVSDVVKNNIKFWTTAKENMDKYATAMSQVNNCFNFVTEAERPNGKSIYFRDLDITLSVPDSVEQIFKATEMYKIIHLYDKDAYKQ